MTLRERLDTIKEGAAKRIPAEAREVMQRATNDLRATGAVDRAVKVGERAPDFTLPDASGRSVRLADLVARGPVVLSFFRGRW